MIDECLDKNPIGTLIERCLTALSIRGLSSITVNNYKEIFNQLLKYCIENNLSEFNTHVGFSFLNYSRNIDDKILESRLETRDKFFLRAINLLEEFNKSGLILYRYNKPILNLKDKHLEVYNNFNSYNLEVTNKITQQKDNNRNVLRFLHFIEANNIDVSAINLFIVMNYIKSFSAYSNYFIRNNIASLKLFINFLKNRDIIISDIKLPSVKITKLARIPSIWKQEDILNLLNSIDRSNNIGKRDFAIILLTIRLGIRSIDIKHLTFDNINWEKNTIEFIQSKTNKLLVLPLLKDVGWALIDYIKHGRPSSNERYIFLTHNPPFKPFTDETSLHSIINKYIKLSGIVLKNQKKGLHSLRHTLATRLFEQNTPIDEISSILGHKSTESTPAYIKSSIQSLTNCYNDDDFI